MNAITRYSKSLNAFPVLPMVLTCALCVAPTMCTNAVTVGKTFASPNDAVNALAAAVDNRDTNALANIFGPGYKEIRSTDPVQAQNELATVAEKLREGTRIEQVASNQCIVDVGRDQFPFAVPIVQNGGAWYFDTDAGKQELINRRIGRNELEALKSVRAYDDAQRQYASKDRNGDQVLEYAQKPTLQPGARKSCSMSARPVRSFRRRARSR